MLDLFVFNDRLENGISFKCYSILFINSVLKIEGDSNKLGDFKRCQKKHTHILNRKQLKQTTYLHYCVKGSAQFHFIYSRLAPTLCKRSNAFPRRSILCFSQTVFWQMLNYNGKGYFPLFKY